MSEGRREWAERIADQFGVTGAAAIDAIEEGVQRGLSLATRPSGLADVLAWLRQQKSVHAGGVSVPGSALVAIADLIERRARAAKPADERLRELPREPTQAMLMAGRKQTFADMTGAHCGPSAENTWKAMFDAALSETVK